MESVPHNAQTPLLSPGAARIFFNAADAWHPAREDEERPGASRVDLLAGLPSALGSEEARRLSRALYALEWLPRFCLRRSGFSWLPRPERRALLRSLEGHRFGPLRRRALRLRTIVDTCYQSALRERALAQESSPSE